MGKIKEWFTGRKDLYFDKVKYESLLENINAIKTGPVVEARDNVCQAVKALNNVNGMQQYVGAVSEGAFNDIFDGGVVSCIDNVVAIMEQKRTDAENYSNASVGEKILGSATMAVGKIGEGFISVFEGIGDGVLSLVGFTGGLLGAKGFRDSIGEMVEFDVAEKATSWITDSEIAKKSAFTKDSGTAGLFEAVGQTGGYLALGGFANGIARGYGSAGGKVGKIANGLFGTSTRANTTNAVLGGLGRGTETGLKQGMDFNHAFGEGAKQGAIQGALAYGAGKWSEHSQKQKLMKQQEAALKEQQGAQAAYDAKRADYKNAVNDLKTAQQRQDAFDYPGRKAAIDKKYIDAGKPLDSTSGWLKEQQMLEADFNKLKGATAAAQGRTDLLQSQLSSKDIYFNRLQQSTMKVENINNQLANVQGYNDPLSNWARGKGETVGASLANNGLGGTVKLGLASAGTALSGAGTSIKNGIKHPIATAKGQLSSAGTSLKNAGHSLANGARNMIANPGATLRTVGTTVAKGVPIAAVEGVEAEWNRENHLKGLGAVEDIEVDKSKLVGCVHNWVETGRVEPTTTTDGSVTYTCSKCGLTKTDVLPKLGQTTPSTCSHNWVFVNTTDGGDKWIDNYKCSLCGETKVSSRSKDGDHGGGGGGGGGHTHNFVFVQTVPPTTLERGYDLYRCDCGATEKRNFVNKIEEIPDPFEHVCKFVFKYHVNPTYTSEGYDVYGCDCGKTEKRNIVPKLSNPSDNGHTGPNINDLTDDLTNEEDLNINEDNTNVETSLAELIGSSGVNIPTSEEPIFETKKKRKSMIPLVAGLGSAAVAGLVTKSILDKKDEEEDSEDLGTEEWADDSLDSSSDMLEEDVASVSLDDVEGDYLTPKDEYGYGEASDSEDEIYESTSEVVTE